MWPKAPILVLCRNVAIFCKLVWYGMNRMNVFAIHRCINEGYGLIRIFTEKIRISPTKLWRVCHCRFANIIVSLATTCASNNSIIGKITHKVLSMAIRYYSSDLELTLIPGAPCGPNGPCTQWRNMIIIHNINNINIHKNWIIFISNYMHAHTYNFHQILKTHNFLKWTTGNLHFLQSRNRRSKTLMNYWGVGCNNCLIH